MDICFRCKEKIDSVDDFSIDHKDPWLHSTDPKKLFFDLENVAFSHEKCNYKHRKRATKSKNKHGYQGVFYEKRLKANPWRAKIVIKGKTTCLGSFSTKEQAAAAYKTAARLHPV